MVQFYNLDVDILCLYVRVCAFLWDLTLESTWTHLYLQAQLVPQLIINYKLKVRHRTFFPHMGLSHDRLDRVWHTCL